MSESVSDRLLVNKQNLARCAWCGTPESPKWMTSEKGEIFCSSECELAKHSSRSFNGGFLLAVSSCIIILIPIIAMLRFPVPSGQIIPSSQFGSVAGWILSGFLLLITGIGAMIRGYEGQKYRDRKDKYRNVTLLECEYCAQTNPPNVVRCQYCGASLTKAPFKYETTPPWIRQEMYLGRFRCPHCSSTYSYNVSKIEKDGSIKCQNCGKPFTPPLTHAQWHEPTAKPSIYADV
ncbi:MAG: MJ0042-type zinc finger domain-containing protein [Candidatus Thorarchaeota archaeon]